MIAVAGSLHCDFLHAVGRADDIESGTGHRGHAAASDVEDGHGGGTVIS